MSPKERKQLDELRHKLAWQNHLAPYECEWIIDLLEERDKVATRLGNEEIKRLQTIQEFEDGCA